MKENRRWDVLILNVRAATMAAGSDDNGIAAGSHVQSAERGYGLIEDAAIGIKNGVIDYCGPAREIAGAKENLAQKVISGDNALATPGLVDCHTHLVYAGSRTREFELRLNGMSYKQIAESGGGILSTVQSTRDATDDQLFDESLPRLKCLVEGGVTTVEIKSGYGLNTDAELKMLRVARKLGSHLDVRVITSFLGAHALPTEYAGRSDDYIALVCEEMIPAVAASGLADAVDAFCENIAFSRDQIEKVFQAASDYSIPVKIHAEQLSNQSGARLAAQYHALSADHLEYLEVQDIAELAASGTVPVLLPGAFYFLNETQLPPVDGIRKAGLPIALATDANPGSSPVFSLLLIMNMACTLFKLTPAEALAGVTRCAAMALGKADEIGTLECGKVADIALWSVEDPAELAYRIGDNPLIGVVSGGNYQTVNVNFVEVH